MTKNMGSRDRTIRIVAAVVFGLLVAAGVVTGPAALLLGVLAGVFLVTSYLKFCPLYVPFKIDTSEKE